MKKFEQMAGTRKFIIKMLLSIQDDEDISLEEFNEYDNEQLTEEFLSAGFVTNEETFYGVFEDIPKNYINVEVVGDITGWPASIAGYYEQSPNPLMNDESKLGKKL